MPEVYCQKATSSLVVTAGASAALSAPTRSAYASSPAVGRPTTTTCVRSGDRERTSATAETSDSLAITTVALLSLRMYS